MAPPSPIVARWDLGRRLRERRELLGLTGGQGAALGGLSPTFLSDVEHGRKSLPLAKLDALIAGFEFTAEEADELQALREQGGERGWWSRFGGLFSDEILRMFGFEHGADAIVSYDDSLVPGLLQTADYARAVFEAGSPNVRLAEAELRVQARLVRQRRLGGDDPPRLTVVIGEAVLRQRVGGPAVLREQLRHLRDLVDHLGDTLDLLVVPFDSPGHPAMGGAFHVLTFPSPTLPNLAWLETVTATEIVEDLTTVREYGIAHAGAMHAALNKTDSLALIRSTHEEMT